jgi:hypothetical protein
MLRSARQSRRRAVPNSSAAPPLSRPAWQREAPAAIRAGVYVGQASYNSVIFGYRARNKSNRAPECSIAYQNFAQSQIAVDASGTVVAVGKNGIFYGVGGTHVSVCTRSGCTSELTDSSIKQLETAAVDAEGTVWASYYNQSGEASGLATASRGSRKFRNSRA